MATETAEEHSQQMIVLGNNPTQKTDEEKESYKTEMNSTFLDKAEEDSDEAIVMYQHFDDKVTPLVVRVGCTIYDLGLFDVAAGTVTATFDLWLIYDDDLFKKTFGNTRETLPWTMPNGLELDITRYETYKMYGIDLDSLNIWTKKRKQEFFDYQKENKLTKFRVESYSIHGTMKLTTFPSEDPFQSIYLVVKLALDGTPGSETTQYKPSKGDCYFPGCRKHIADFTKGGETVREFRITASYGEYSRIYFIFEYKKSPMEDLAKYYILPLLINALTIGFYHTVDSLFDSAGAYFLAIIALLFTLPDTGAFTRNEKAVVIGAMWMLTILLVLITLDSLQSQIILWICLCLSYIVLIVYDTIASHKAKKKYRDVLFTGDLT
eukprot:945002_1